MTSLEIKLRNAMKGSSFRIDVRINGSLANQIKCLASLIKRVKSEGCNNRIDSKARFVVKDICRNAITDIRCRMKTRELQKELTAANSKVLQAREIITELQCKICRLESQRADLIISQAEFAAELLAQQMDYYTM